MHLIAASIAAPAETMKLILHDLQMLSLSWLHDLTIPERRRAKTRWGMMTMKIWDLPRARQLLPRSACKSAIRSNPLNFSQAIRSLPSNAKIEVFNGFIEGINLPETSKHQRRIRRIQFWSVQTSCGKNSRSGLPNFGQQGRSLQLGVCFPSRQAFNTKDSQILLIA